MRYVFFVFLLAVSFQAAAEDPNVLKGEVYTHIQAAETKQRQLCTKTYAGTIDQILITRVADVNDVAVEIAQAKAKCERVLLQTGEKIAVADKLKTIISEQSKEKEILDKKRNGEFMNAVNQIITDPNGPSAGDDPEEVARMAFLWEAVTELIALSGGL